MDHKAKALVGLLAATCVFSFIALILSIVNVKDVILPPSTKYGLVFDAGSTHTALYIYRWRADKENGTGIVSQVETCTAAGPGISSYADDPAGAGASLKPCLDKAMEIIPAEQQRETPTYLGATAGMRLLRYSTARSRQEGLKQGDRILEGRDRDCDYLQLRLTLAVLSGQYSFAEKWEHPQDAEVFGALDLGGASTQITFQPGVTIEDKNTSVFFRLYGTNYSLYTHSYLCYGQTQALKRLLAALHQVPSTAQISHPCYPRGYQENITTAELYDSPCVRAPSSPSAVQLLRVMGTGEPAACSAAIQQLFNLSCGANSTCGFNGVYQPPVRGQFFAFAGFYYTFYFLNLTSQQSLKDVNSTVQAFCKKDWAEVRALQVHVAPWTKATCGWERHFWMTFAPSPQAANTDIGWTLGFMLNLTNMIPTEALEHVKGQQPSLWAGAVSCIVLATVAGLVTGFLPCFRKSK
uniref:Ectonucleoside triphosphate diphosphohydrolase 8 n=1 Tax=Melopsittacus undulatus TaxID=13146 RepID=A0A8V5HHD3_MELUD